jgi:hypothetical protein
MSKRVNLKAVQFSSNGDTIDIADSDNLSFTDGSGTDKPFSISAWVYVGNIATDSGVIISRRNRDGAGVQDGEWIIEHVNGKIKAYLYADNAYNEQAGFSTSNRLIFESSAANLTSATWHFITVTYDASQATTGLKVYKDGTEITANKTVQKNLYAGMPNYNIVTTIGGTDSPDTNTFEDNIADVVVFDKELSQTEITEIYNGGKVKNMTKATTYNNIISWWKMGDDTDAPIANGIKDYVGSNNGTMVGDSVIVTVPALDTDRIGNDGVMIPSSWGRTRQPKNIAGDHQVYVHGGIAGNMPTTVPSGVDAGYALENQRYLHLYWKAASTTAAVTAWTYSHASGDWSELYDTGGTQVKLSVSGAPADTMRIFEVSGVDRVYFRQSGTALAATDLFAAAASSF